MSSSFMLEFQCSTQDCKEVYHTSTPSKHWTRHKSSIIFEFFCPEHNSFSTWIVTTRSALPSIAPEPRRPGRLSNKNTRETNLVKRVKAWAKKQGILCIKIHGSPYMPRGLPDLLMIEDGKVWFVETKSLRGEAKKHQLRMHEKLEIAGAQVLVARTLQHVDNFHSAQKAMERSGPFKLRAKITCGPCHAGDHWACGLQSWCECQNERDGQEYLPPMSDQEADMEGLV